MRSITFAVTTAIVLLAACAEQPAQPVQVASDNSSKQVCTRESHIGSNIPRSVCRTSTSDGKAQDAVDDFAKENQTTLNRTNGGFGR